MKAILTTGLAVYALTLYAAEPQEKPKATATTVTATDTAAQAQVQDSPMVRAAKRTGRLGKKPTNVITNEMLLKTGHLSTGTTQAPLPGVASRPAPASQPNASAQRQKHEAQAAAEKAAAARRDAVRRANADYNDDSVEPRHQDPAAQAHEMEQGAPQKPPGV